MEVDDNGNSSAAVPPVEVAPGVVELPAVPPVEFAPGVVELQPADAEAAAPQMTDDDSEDSSYSDDSDDSSAAVPPVEVAPGAVELPDSNAKEIATAVVPNVVFSWCKPPEWFEYKECLQYLDHNMKDNQVSRICFEYKEAYIPVHGVVWVTPEQLRAWPSAFARHGKWLERMELNAVKQ
jgi:hypothetical protein